MPWLWSKVVTGVASVSRRRTRRQRKADLLARLQANGTYNATNITDAGGGRADEKRRKEEEEEWRERREGETEDSLDY